jgi:hypothetical protein
MPSIKTIFFYQYSEIELYSVFLENLPQSLQTISAYGKYRFDIQMANALFTRRAMNIKKIRYRYIFWQR